MDYFHYQHHELFAEQVSVRDIVHQYGSPCYIYSRHALENNWREFNDAFQQHPHLICFAVKANSNLAVLNVLARLGSGFDIVSVGELERVLTAGGLAQNIIFSGVGKQSHEIKRALDIGINSFNVESASELERIQHIAKQTDSIANIALRINPDVDAETHHHISTGLKENKFGIAIDEALDLYLRAKTMSHIFIKGIHCHIGSQINSLNPFIAALEKILALVATLKAKQIDIEQINLGGGLGIAYQQEDENTYPSPNRYVTALLKHVKQLPYRIILEPGRAIAGNAGILVTQVEYLKNHGEKKFVIVDAAMNDLMRPALYWALHDITAVSEKKSSNKDVVVDVVGPICETADCFAKDQHMTCDVGDLLAFHSAGAYGFVMSSNYNSRPRLPEIMVDGKQVHLIRKRETISELFAAETILP